MKKITQEELNQILQQHKLWIETDGNKGGCAVLKGTDLLGANLRHANLHAANLRYACLQGADPRAADLQGADLRFASPGTKFTTAHGKLGLPPEYGLSWMLPRIVGLTRALDILLSSRVMLAEEALEWGYLNAIHPADELLDRVLDYAEQLASGVAAGSLRETRQQVYLDLHRDVGTSVTESLRLLDSMMKHPEYREGVQALVEKRPPDF